MYTSTKPLLAAAQSAQGLHHRIKLSIQTELQNLSHVQDSEWLLRRLKAVGVREVGTSKSAVSYWNEQAKKQIEALFPTSSVKSKATKKKASQPPLVFETKQLALF